MVYLFEPFGGLSNNLFQHIHFDSYCRENNIPFVNPFIAKYTGVQKQVPASATFKSRKFLTALHLAKLIEFNNEKDNQKDVLLKKYSPVFVKGWSYRNHPLTLKNREYYRNFFFQNFESQEDPIQKGIPNIAVHIRRGDYAQWQNGIYFFSDEVYLDALDRMHQLLGSDCKVLLFTNDRSLDQTKYRSRFSNIYFSNNDEKTDHYLMSKCDYIIGPPSTFSMWGSYIGNTKFYHLKKANENFSLSDFEICGG
jgi:hypothetical protein